MSDLSAHVLLDLLLDGAATLHVDESAYVLRWSNRVGRSEIIRADIVETLLRYRLVEHVETESGRIAAMLIPTAEGIRQRTRLDE